MTHNADNTITLQVPGKGGAMKDITFKPSKELESQLRVPTAPAQPTSPVSTPNNAPR